VRAGIAVLSSVILFLWVAPAVARAGDPIMPFSQVRAGMHCTGLSVIRGTAISSFDVEIVDVVDGQPGQEGPRFLVRVSGPAVDRTGVGFGFSGSPIYCRDSQGVSRNAGAISESVGEYGNKSALAPPIEQILAEPAEGARATGANRLAAPLTVTGLGPPVSEAFMAAARRAGRRALVAPARPLGSFPKQSLRPGSQMAIALSDGDVSLTASGAVAYRDGDTIWALGHPLDGTGARSLLLQDAYVYDVVNDPNGAITGGSYKLTAPGHDLGTVLNDAPAGVVSRLGALPARIPLRIVARDVDRGRVSFTDSSVADETDLGLPSGVSPLGFVGPLALAQASTSILRGAPVNGSGSMCARIEVRELDFPMRFCNRYVAVPGALFAQDEEELAGLGVQTDMVDDFITALDLLDAFELGTLHPTRVEANVKLRRGLLEAIVLRGTAPRRVRAGQLVRIRLLVHRRRGKRRRLSFKVRIPRDLRPGERTLVLRGGEPRDADQDLVDILALGLEEGGGDTGPRTPEELAAAIASIRRYDGLIARFGRGVDPRPVYRHPVLRLSGRVEIPLRVVRRRRR
jgi:hypothetical protein